MGTYLFLGISWIFYLIGWTFDLPAAWLIGVVVHTLVFLYCVGRLDREWDLMRRDTMDATRYWDKSMYGQIVPDYGVRLGVLREAVSICGRSLPVAVDRAMSDVAEVYRQMMELLMAEPGIGGKVEGDNG